MKERVRKSEEDTDECGFILERVSVSVRGYESV